MAYGKHALVSWGGYFGGSNPGEIWQCGVRIINQVSGSEWLPDPQGYADWVKPRLLAWFQSAEGQQRNDAYLKYVKVNNINPDGTYADPVTHRADYADGLSGGAAPTLPDFCMVAWSWRTDVERGPGANGRVYTPNVAARQNQGDSRITSANQALQLAGAAALLNAISAISAAGGISTYPVVASRQGAVRPITQIRCGDVIDVQRRRKNKFLETYATAAYSH